MEIISNKLERELVGTDGRTASLCASFPQLSSGARTSGIKRINRYYRKCAKVLLSCFLRRRPADADSYICSTRFTVPLCTENTISVYREVCETIDGIRYPPAGYAETWDMPAGVPAAFASVSGCEKLSSLLLRATPAEDMFIPARYAGVESLKKHFSKDRFYLSPEGLHIFYQPGTLAPFEYGIAVFRIKQAQPPGK